MDNRIIGASIGTLTALNALALINVAPPIFKVNRTFRTYLLTRTSQTVLAVFFWTTAVPLIFPAATAFFTVTT